jgi:hypothetical protein
MDGQNLIQQCPLPPHTTVDNIVCRIGHSIITDLLLCAGLLAAIDKVPHCFVAVTSMLLLTTDTPMFTSVSTTMD